MLLPTYPPILLSIVLKYFSTSMKFGKSIFEWFPRGNFFTPPPSLPHQGRWKNILLSPVSPFLEYWRIVVKIGLCFTWHPTLKILLFVSPNSNKKNTTLKSEKKSEEVSIWVINGRVFFLKICVLAPWMKILFLGSNKSYARESSLCSSESEL